MRLERRRPAFFSIPDLIAIVTGQRIARRRPVRKVLQSKYFSVFFNYSARTANIGIKNLPRNAMRRAAEPVWLFASRNSCRTSVEIFPRCWTHQAALCDATLLTAAPQLHPCRSSRVANANDAFTVQHRAVEWNMDWRHGSALPDRYPMNKLCQ